MVLGKNLFYPVVGFALCVGFIYMSFGDLWSDIHHTHHADQKLSFVERNGTHFVVDGRIFYVNGWNSYWMMDHAVSMYSKPRIKQILRAGAKMGLTVCRTWAFNDGDYNALQVSPGQFNEEVFRVNKTLLLSIVLYFY